MRESLDVREVVRDTLVFANHPPVLSSFNNLNIYAAGTTATVFVGFSRIATIVLFVYGCFAVAPQFYFDPTHSTLWAPAVLTFFAIPILATALATAPFVSNVRVILPTYARRSRETLTRFAANVPPDTKLVVQTMRFIPWPMHREIAFSSLRRVRAANKGSANLEINPPGEVKARQRAEGDRLWYAWMVKRMYGRLYVNRSQVKDKSAAPGIWDTMWEQIPMVGDASPKRVPQPAIPVVANRKEVTAHRFVAQAKTAPASGKPAHKPVRRKHR